MKTMQAAISTQFRYRVRVRSSRIRSRPNWARKLWHRSTACRTLPTPLAALAGRPQPEPGGRDPVAGGAVLVRPVRVDRRPGPVVGFGRRPVGGRRPDHPGVQDRAGLDPVVGVRPGHDRAEGHRPAVAGEVDGRAALAPVHRRRAGPGPPFFAGFLDPSSRTWSPSTPCVW